MSMTQTDVTPDAPRKKALLPVIIGLVLLIAGGGGGFVLTFKGLIPGLSRHQAPAAQPAVDAMPQVAFVPLDPVIISLGSTAARHLRFSGQLEVASAYQKDVETLKPRVMDVLNGYLRAVDIADLQEPSALIRLRAQMLRRIQIVTGEGRVRDLLISEFVLN